MKSTIVQRIQPLSQPGLAKTGTETGGTSDATASAKSGGLSLLQKARAITANADTPAAHTCQQCLWVSVFFDGTGNNRDADLPTLEHSNIARLWRAHPDLPKMGIVPVYIPGIGTPFKEIGDDGKGPIPIIDLSKGMGARGQDRLEAAFQRLAKAVIDAEARAQNPTNKIVWIKLAVFGFSRGATLARTFVRDLLDPKLGKTTQVGGELRWKGHQGQYALSIEFMGLFDTVASVGLPMSSNNLQATRSDRRRMGNALKKAMNGRDNSFYLRAQDIAFGAPGADPAPGFADGHNDWADGLAIPPAVKQCVHFIAAHELRNSFPVDSVARAGSKPANCKEMIYPGDHSDVGGGYRPGEGGQGKATTANTDNFDAKIMLSLIPLRAMYDEAVSAGVPFEKINGSGWKKINQDDFSISPMLINLFNHYRATVGSGGRALGTEMLAHTRQYFAWRWHRIAQGRHQQLAQLQKNEAVFQQDQEALAQRKRLLVRKMVHQTKTDAARLADEIAEIDAQLNTAAGTGTLAGNLSTYDAELLADVQSILSVIEQNPAKRAQLRPHYKNLVETYEAQFVHKRGLNDPKIIAFFDNHVHDSLAGFAMDSTLPSDPRVIYTGSDNKLQYATVPDQVDGKKSMVA